MESASNISFFFEENAFDNGELRQAKEMSINKIGHGNPMPAFIHPPAHIISLSF